MFFVAYARRLLRRDPEFSFTFYCEQPYIAQVQSMLKPFGERAAVAPNSDRPAHAVSTWIGDEDFFQKHPQAHNYTVLYQDWFKHLSQKLGVQNPISSAYDLLMEADEDDHFYGAFDCLVVNSSAQSSQWLDTTPMFDAMIAKLRSDGFRVAKTHPSAAEADLCTMDENMSIQQLINFAPNCARVVGVNNAPMVATISTGSIYRIKSWHVCDHWTYYDYPRFSPIRDAAELNTLIPILTSLC